MSNDQVSVRLTGLTFGQRSGIMRTELENDGIVSISYGVEAVAEATVSVESHLLLAPCELTLPVNLGERGVDDAVAQARLAVRRFLAELATAEFRF